MKIITITFSPCIDKSTSVPSMIAEKKLLCSSPKLDPGGGGINVARAIKKLGGDAVAVFPSGGYTGKYFNYLMEKEGIKSVIIETQNETRENIIVVDESTNRQYRFGMPGTALHASEVNACLDALEKIEEGGYIIASGSLPPGVPSNIYAQIARIARSKNAKFVVDTSGEALKEAVDEGVYLLKPNLGELSFLSGKERIETGEVENIAREILIRNKCDIMVVSLGSEGAMLVSAGEAYKVKAPEAEKKSTVGAGDSMVAGIIYLLSEGYGLEDALKYGVAAGTAATLHEGTELCNKEDTRKLYEQMCYQKENEMRV